MLNLPTGDRAVSILKLIPMVFLAWPLSAQAWDVRLEAPFPQAQNLPQTTVQGAGQTSGSLGTGQGAIVTLSHRIMRMGPVLKYEWNVEYSQWQASGTLQQGAASSGSRLRQSGFGAGVNAQFWVPFTGFAGELGLLERFQTYRFDVAVAVQAENIARPWLRVGLRWVLPFPGIGPYLAASYQAPLTRNRPVQAGSAQDLNAYLGAQGSGQEFQHLWTVGLGIAF